SLSLFFTQPTASSSDTLSLHDALPIFGGRNRNDTWTFDGSTWAPAAGGAASPVTPSPPPPANAGSWATLARLATGRIDQTATVLDRKSTRLNSSHLGISYAVFCLKKKI